MIDSRLARDGTEIRRRRECNECRRRFTTRERVDGVLPKVCKRVERALQETGEREVQSRDVGERVMEELKSLDALAAARFASVFRNFQDAEDYAKFFASIESGETNASR